MPLSTIDLAGLLSTDVHERDALARAVGAAARDHGMFYAVNHGVAASLLADHFRFAREFFALDLAEKRSIDVSRSNCFRGYESLGSQTIDPAAPGDLKEGFIMGPDLPPDHPHVVARHPNTGSNLWPRRPLGLRRHMETYVAAMNELGRRLAAALALSLGLPDDYFATALREPLTYAQLFTYPSIAASGPNRFGAGAHVDWGLFTILLQDDVGGLEVCTPDGRWEAAPAIAGSLVIILGEMVLRLTNGAYRSALHRVARNASGRARYSMPTFVDPAYDVRIACVPTCLPASGEPRFAECTVAEHMREMAHQLLSAPRPQVSFGS